jgi:hypothetical protein
MTVRWFATQSPVSDPGSAVAALEGLPTDLASLRRLASQLVFHYRTVGDLSESGIAPGRLAEIDTRYAAEMLTRLVELQPSLAAPRPPALRLVGCGRDVALLLVSMVRHAGLPARVRVGFASYLLDGWYLDHGVAEVYDPVEERWRLVDAQLPDGFQPSDGSPFDLLDVPRERFLTGPTAWLEARAGVREVERFAVDPCLESPETRGWAALRHHLVHDLAALSKTEMLPSDSWGLIEGPLPDERGSLAARRELEELDHLARLLADPACPVENIEDWAGRDGLRPPQSVTSHSPASPSPLAVDVRRALRPS